MGLFSKHSSKKNKTVSTTTTPLTTPRTSVQYDAHHDTNMHSQLSHADVVDRLDRLRHVGHLQAMAYCRI
ncbi:hypothetical protein DFQ26_005828 [Actinomortierella ambigua]|nr:hypothetical protein DFQ26_005828 [Actinomortierella ambigua]